MKELTVVMYHYVRPIKSSRYPGIKGLEVESFIKQLEYFLSNYNVVSMQEVLASYYENASLPNNALLLTFDDAYSDHFNYVYPILRKYDLQGTFFVPVKTVTHNAVLDVNKIHFILSSGTAINVLVSRLKDKLNEIKIKYSLKDFDEYYDELAISNKFDCKDVVFIKSMLQHALPEFVRNKLSDELFSEFVKIEEKSFNKELYLNKYQLEEMIRGGMYIGCHGFDHYWWNKLPYDELYQEIYKSKEFLKVLGCDMDNWIACYPYGSYSDEAVKILGEQGCKLAFTTDVRLADMDSDHPLLIPRFDTNDFYQGE